MEDKMFIFTFGSIRVSFRMIVKFFKTDGKLFSHPCEKWVSKGNKQFTLFNSVKIEKKDSELLHPSQPTRFEVTDENGKPLVHYDRTQNIWWFESMKRIKVFLQSNGTSTELRAEYVASENGVYHLRVDNPDKRARLVSSPKSTTKSTEKPAPAIDPKLADKIADEQRDHGHSKNGDRRLKRHCYS